MLPDIDTESLQSQSAPILGEGYSTGSENFQDDSTKGLLKLSSV